MSTTPYLGWSKSGASWNTNHYGLLMTWDYNRSRIQKMKKSRFRFLIFSTFCFAILDAYSLDGLCIYNITMRLKYRFWFLNHQHPASFIVSYGVGFFVGYGFWEYISTIHDLKNVNGLPPTALFFRLRFILWPSLLCMNWNEQCLVVVATVTGFGCNIPAALSQERCQGGRR